ncbi:hypothetical protein GTP55_01290 [Duganella sp. FT109W]|uniref:Thoeris protein ThsA Macro domain-containing protein n=1 Tax=Duganella margarita TaxID=2692170 RepID=A0ABW9WBT2_9BURK|nr:macro domain-containing protein [Duganella margarita]MYN37997.1 hypothetical protein [Duganella margarita]
MEILQDLRTWRFWRHFLTMSFACLGGLSTVLQTSSVINPEVKIFQGTPVLIAVIVISLVFGLKLSWPRPISQDYSAPKTKITIVEGNMLAETTHLVIGTNDTFDTETPNIIAQSSLQGQALQVLFGGDLRELDAQLTNALTGKPTVGTIAKAGKQTRFGVGTVATVRHAARLIFFLAYAEMDAQNTAHSTPDKVWTSLRLLWDEISKRGNGGTVSVPVIGGGQARLSSVLPAQDAIRLTILSFMFASRNEKVCDELRIVVRPEDYKKLDRLELQSFLSSLRSS